MFSQDLSICILTFAIIDNRGELRLIEYLKYSIFNFNSSIDNLPGIIFGIS